VVAGDGNRGFFLSSAGEVVRIKLKTEIPERVVGHHEFRIHGVIALGIGGVRGLAIQNGSCDCGLGCVRGLDQSLRLSPSFHELSLGSRDLHFCRPWANLVSKEVEEIPPRHEHHELAMRSKVRHIIQPDFVAANQGMAPPHDATSQFSGEWLKRLIQKDDQSA